ncbi:MAG: C-terminal binding protein [Chloroflexota bacterium]|nr:C-terminal binding protein [Chloroflexota bacterium]
MSKFKVMTQKPSGITFDLAGAPYDLEMESLGQIEAEIIEIPAASEEDFVESARYADAIIARGRPITKKIISGLEGCQIIALGSVGSDQVDVAAATEKGIPVTHVPDTFIEEVADHTMMMILSTFRRLTTMDRYVREGRWAEGRPLLSRYPRLMGQTLGFVSFGHVARATAVRAKAFGVRMLAYDPYIEELAMSEYGVEPVSLTELLENSDILSMHAPSTPEAHHMLSEEQFKKMKPSALFINNGRGPTVDEKALIKALQEEWIAGAGLDVLETEPPDLENPLIHMDNVILTPHVASASGRMGPETRRRVGQEIALVLSGRWPRTCVNPSVLEKTNLRRWQPYSMGRGPGGWF